MASGIHRLDLESPQHAPSLSLLCVADPIEGNRANEARCDMAGNLWLGSMQNNLGEQGEDIPITRRSGGLFHIGPDANVVRLASDIGIANTLLWSAEGKYVYTADTLEGVIYRYAIDAGGLTEKGVWAQAHERGHPDGSAMDAQGYVWNARWDGHCLIRFAPDGCVDTVIELPVSRPTSCVFGGSDLKTLYVTSAAGDQPLDGSVLSARVDVAGLPCHRFAG
jgi:sugar lactone lactonase YvrE